MAEVTHADKACLPMSPPLSPTRLPWMVSTLASRVQRTTKDPQRKRAEAEPGAVQPQESDSIKPGHSSRAPRVERASGKARRRLEWTTTR